MMIISYCNSFARCYITSSFYKRCSRVSITPQYPAWMEALLRDSRIAQSRPLFSDSNRGSVPIYRRRGPRTPHFSKRMLLSCSSSSGDVNAQPSAARQSSLPSLHMAEQLDKHNVSKPKSHFLPRPGSVKRRYRAIQSQVSQASINQIEDIVPSGLLAVFKPQNWTSFDVVAKIKGVLQGELQGKYGIKATKLKVGHGGTLDPMATGVLVLGIGAGTKYMSDYLAGPKAYIASAALGTETNTLDSTGKVTGTAPSGHVTADMIELLMQKEYIGDIKQIPPMFSALKQNGKRLYDLARNDVEVSREPRDVTVYDLQLLSFTESEGKVPSTSCKSFEFYVSCSGGFYVRSLISDLGRACGSAAHMTSLERTQQGPFSLKDCLRQENWTFDEIKNTLVQHNALSKFGKIKSKHVP